MAQRDANWVDGVRGISSFAVVTGHICTAFWPDLHAPANADGSFSIFQLPFFRLILGGRVAVALFFIITGYVNSIGTITKARAGNTDVAYSSLARSTFGRVGRLVLPTALATCIAWLMAQLSMFKMAEHIDATWIRQGYKGPEASLVEAIYKLLHANVLTWTTGWDEYDGTQWTLVHFLTGSMMVYTTLLATISFKPRARRMVMAVVYIYGWLCPQLYADVRICNIAMGMLIAELHGELETNATSYLPRVIPPVLLVIGLFFGGYPQQSVDRMRWSSVMNSIMTAISPAEADNRRRWDSWAGTLIIMSAFFSARFRRLLSNRLFNFLGRVSFPVYLLHNQLMKSLLVWLVYFPSYLNPPPDGKDLVRAPLIHLAIALVIFYYILYRIALLWTLFVDPLIGRVIKSVTLYALDTGSPIEKAIASSQAQKLAQTTQQAMPAPVSGTVADAARLS